MPDGVLVAVTGELDVVSARYLREQLVEAVQEHPPNLRMDLSEVSFLDSSTVGVLVSIKRRVEKYGGKLSVLGGPQSRAALGRRGLLAYLGVDPI